MNIEDLRSIVENEECGHIEYKMQWYWDFNDRNDIDNLAKKWGEFIKDVLAIANANIASFEYERYIVYGFHETEKKFYDSKVPTEEKAYRRFLDNIKSKINDFITPSLSEISFHDICIEDKNIFVIKILQHPNLFSLKNDIQTNSIIYRKGSTLFREEGVDGKLDSVGVMGDSDSKKYNALIENYYSNSYISNKTIQTKSIKSTINTYLRNSSNLEIVDTYPKIEKKNDDRYEIYKIVNRVHNNFEYFVFIDGSSSMKNLVDSIKQIEKFEVEPFLLTNKPADLKNPEKRIQYLKKISGWKQVSFIDDFGRNYLYKEQIKDFLFEKFLNNTPYFINSLTEFKGQKKIAMKVLEDWYLTDDMPLMVITGEGGIGKTEIVRQFLNKNLKENENFLLYLDSETVINNTSTKVTDIYHIYRSIASEHNSLFYDELFKLCIDNGTLIVVIDGLDEVVARLSTKFNLTEFVQSIVNNYSFNLTRAKIIITCRDSIWDSFIEKESEKILEMKLLPFSTKQVRSYFENSYSDNKTIGKAISAAEKLKFNIAGEAHFSPFVVDTIRRLLEQNPEAFKDESFKVDSNLSEEFYFSNNPTDFLIMSVLKREFLKNSRLDVSKQIQIFVEMSDTPNGMILKEDLFSSIKSKVVNDFEKTEFESFLTHQFLNIRGNEVSFRYDFFKEFFSVLQMTIYINNQNVKLINCITNKYYKNLGYQNTFTKEIAKKIKIPKDDIDVIFADLLSLEYIKIYLESNEIILSQYEIEEKISLSLCLYLTILNQLNEFNNLENLKEIISMFFEKNGEINGLCLINFNSSNLKPKVVFDFKSKKLTNCSFKYYSNFLECEFDEETYFSHSCAVHIGEEVSTKTKNLKLSKKNFDVDTDLNTNMKNMLDEIEASNGSKLENKEKQFRDFLRIFMKNGDFKPQKQEFIKSRKGGSLVKTMLANEVIINNTRAKINMDEFIINPIHSNDLYDYLHQSSPSKFVNDVLESM